MEASLHSLEDVHSPKHARYSFLLRAILGFVVVVSVSGERGRGYYIGSSAVWKLKKIYILFLRD